MVFLIGCENTKTVKEVPKNEEKSSEIVEPEPEVPNTMRPAIMIDGELYYVTLEKIKKSNIDLDSVSYVESVVDGTMYPKKDGEINFPCENAPYIREEDGVVIKINDSWILFKKDE